MTAIAFKGREIATDELGHLLEAAARDRDLALVLAAREGVELGQDPWCLIDFVREWYDSQQAVPEARRLLQAMRQRLGEEKATRKYLHRLFPYGYAPGLCKIAGMPMPRKLMLDV